MFVNTYSVCHCSANTVHSHPKFMPVNTKIACPSQSGCPKKHNANLFSAASSAEITHFHFKCAVREYA